ncbi:MAG: hypothetical protein JKY12_07905 [Sneathiella sp.]|nr:hypothetical protein [Sneathiella sp.]
MKLKILGMAFLLTALTPATPTFATSLQSQIAAYDAEDCAPVVEQELSAQSIDPKKISKIEYITIHKNPGDDFGEDFEYEGWISFDTCKGNYVVNMDRACFINQAYATHECKIEGIPTRQ